MPSATTIAYIDPIIVLKKYRLYLESQIFVKPEDDVIPMHTLFLYKNFQ